MDVSSLISELKRPWPALVLLMFVVGLLYGHTLDVPMYLDDISSISDNPAIFDATDWARIFAFSEMRFVGYLSFALNYQVHGDAVVGYHIVNLLIHLASGTVLYLLILSMAQTPAMQVAGQPTDIRLWALAAALLFIAHPLHTQAVTYIVQRLASLVALFYLLSLYAYLQGRLTQGGQRIGWLLGAALFGVLALFTKQNAVTLPGGILLLEFCFFCPSAPDRRRWWIAVAGVFLLFAVVLGVAHLSGLATFDQLDAASRETGRITRSDYLAAQTLILWRYLHLFVWPTPLILDYGLQSVWSFSDWQVLIASAGHVILVVGALALARRAPLVTFGVLFYYLAHSIESGLIPIKDLMFEHRTYLPDAGLCIAIASLLARIPQRAAIAAIVAVTLTFSVLTWQRNNLWRDQVAFFNHAIEHAPDQPRNWIYLAKVYHKAGENQQALYFLTQEMTANEQRYGELRVETSTLVFWAKLLRVTGRHDMAERVEADIATKANPIQRLRVLLHKGNAFLSAGEYDQAAAAYEEVLAMDPRQTSAAVNIGVVAMMQEDYEKAIVIFERYPRHPVAASNLPKARAALAGEIQLDGLEERVIEKAQ